MKRLKILSAALSVSCGVGVLMAVILTGNRNTLPRTAVVIPTQNPVSIRSGSSTNSLASSPANLSAKLSARLSVQRTAQQLPDGIDRMITSSISRKSSNTPLRNIEDIIANNKDVENPYPSTDETVIVRTGDTLFAIAQRTGINVHRLAAINAIEAPFIIRSGQILHLVAVQ